MDEFCGSSDPVLHHHQVYDDTHHLGQVYDVTDEATPTSDPDGYVFNTRSKEDMSDNVFTVDNNQLHVTEVRIETNTSEETNYKTMYRR